MYATVCYFGSHHHTWVVSKGKKIMLLLRLPVFLIDCNLICIETCNCKVFLLEVNNKFTAFFLGELCYSSCADTFDCQALAPYGTINYVKYFSAYPSGC